MTAKCVGASKFSETYNKWNESPCPIHSVAWEDLSFKVWSTIFIWQNLWGIGIQFHFMLNCQLKISMIAKFEGSMCKGGHVRIPLAEWSLKTPTPRGVDADAIAKSGCLPFYLILCWECAWRNKKWADCCVVNCVAMLLTWELHFDHCVQWMN